MNYELPKNQSENAELLDADDEKLHRLLGALKKVEAPNDFGFKVKARIAANQPQASRPVFLTPILRYVLPLGVVVMLAGFIAFSLSQQTATPGVATAEPAATEPQIAAALPPQQSSPVVSNVGVAQSPALAATDVEIVASNTARSDAADSRAIKITASAKNKNVAGQSKKKDINISENGGGSVVQALGESKEILPKGLDTTPNSEKVDNFEQNKISLREVLSPIGLDGEFVGKKWKITSVQENSAAMRSGLKVGDVIEAIDGKQLAAETKSAQKFTGKTFRVVRDGKSIEIELN